MPACAKKSVSFVNAAFTTLGEPETMGHDQVSMVSVMYVGMLVMHG